jgi:hypothetical protein
MSSAPSSMSLARSIAALSAMLRKSAFILVLCVFNLPAAVSHATAGVVSPQVLTLLAAKI